MMNRKPGWWLTGLIACLLCTAASAQSVTGEVHLKNMKGKIISYDSLTARDSLVVICFWSVESELSMNELNAFNKTFENWKALSQVRFMAVSIDGAKTANRVRPTANMNEWAFEVYIDLNGDLRKALHSNNLPESIILRRNKIIYTQSGYEPGSESYLLQRVHNALAGKN